MIREFTVRTRVRTEFVDITRQVAGIVRESGLDEGVCRVFVPHTTAAVTINEKADPDVARDIAAALGRIVPEDQGFRHAEGNSDAHVKASLVGSGETILVSGGELLLGTWQAVFFCEFDGPRARRCVVRVSG
ncbi:MAG: secondary thiamine-phosphate synthase enzyme YjbQ [Candidatus Krumholzibacteria bacterium]|nr:secondary thiamine-phosphate synthase enzyme YjbQ [Candidatus Krumholzibacteria bacterium]